VSECFIIGENFCSPAAFSDAVVWHFLTLYVADSLSIGLDPVRDCPIGLIGNAATHTQPCLRVSRGEAKVAPFAMDAALGAEAAHCKLIEGAFADIVQGMLAVVSIATLWLKVRVCVCVCVCVLVSRHCAYPHLTRP
jgi:hypothetical protein